MANMANIGYMIEETDMADTVFEQYGGALYERNGPILDTVEWQSLRSFCYILPPQPEEVHLFARPPLTTQRLQNQVRRFFGPDSMAPGVSQSFPCKQCKLVSQVHD